LGEVGSYQSIDSIIFAKRGYVDLVPPQQEKNFEKFDQRGDGKEGQPLRMQQSTTQVNSIARKEGAGGSRRMAMAVREVK